MALYFLHLSTYSTTSMLICRSRRPHAFPMFETQPRDNMASCRSRSHEHAFLSAMLDAAEAQNFQCPVCLNEFPPTERSLAGRSSWKFPFWDWVFIVCFCPCDKFCVKKALGKPWNASHVRSRIEGAMLAACAHLFCLRCADTLVRTEAVWSRERVKTFLVAFSIWM